MWVFLELDLESFEVASCKVLPGKVGVLVSTRAIRLQPVLMLISESIWGRTSPSKILFGNFGSYWEDLSELQHKQIL